ncbi:HTH domain-containing protein [Halorientalis salina]|uniref:HTH domain-containing protein n=1 Tax=Halorientalis salina TaxID=2932266 RepID=UPI0010AC0FAE|nr:HTH domain-containing protein [Halorientalis salina]
MATNVVEAEASEDETTGEAETGETAATITVTAHLRASPTGAAARRQQAVLERLRAFEAEGTVPDLRIERVGSRVNVPAAEDDVADADAVALYEELEAVADSAGLQLEPFFESRKAVGGLLSAGPPTQRIIVFPVVSLTIRRDGDLVGLYPCWSDGVHESVESCLDALASGDDAANLG